MRLSRFAHLFDHEGGWVVCYNSLTMGVVALAQDQAALLRSSRFDHIDSDSLALLKQNKIVVDSDEDLRDLETAREFVNRPIIGTLCLMLTDACNLRCRYCFVENQLCPTAANRFLPKEVAFEAIDMFGRVLPRSFENGLEEPIINFYGGEPLLCLETMVACLEHITMAKETGRLPANTRVVLNSNATLINDDVAQMLASYGVTASISIDGPQEVHDAVRTDVNGSGSFVRAMAGHEALKRAGVDVGISCALDESKANRVVEIARWIIENLDISVFGFNLLLAPGVTQTGFDLKKYSRMVAKGMVESFTLCQETGVQEERTMRLARSFALGEIHYVDCSACGQQIVIDPSGRIGVCHAYVASDDNFFPFSSTLDPFTHPCWTNWRKRSPINNNECLSCHALSLCGGGCPYNAEVWQGSIWATDPTFCTFAKTMTKYLVGSTAERVISRIRPRAG
ncbi:SPASM domain-containing protein [Patescibacteria group bacterium]|nr:SPASM domain-containing protein [Patescibacteria group bacterium]